MRRLVVRLALVLWCLAPSMGTAAPAHNVPLPYEPAPEFTVVTDRGPLVVGGGKDGDFATIFIARGGESLLSKAIWGADLAKLFTNSPDDVRYVFASYGATTEKVAADLADMRARVDAAITSLPTAAQPKWRDRVYYATGNLLAADHEAEEWLNEWGSDVPLLRAQWVLTTTNQPKYIEARGTSDAGWAKPLSQVGPLHGLMARYGNLACGGDKPVDDLKGKIALVQRGVCPFVDKATNAYTNGATAAVLYTTPDRELVQMGGSCTSCPQIPVAMIDSGPGNELEQALAGGIEVSATLSAERVPAEAIAIDHRGRAREFGTIPYPFNSFLVQDGGQALDNFQAIAYEAQYYHFEHQQDGRQRAEAAAGQVKVIPVYRGVWAEDPGWAFNRSFVEVELPTAAEMSKYDTMEIDLSMMCTDNRKAKCPAWDYLVYLYVCDVASPDKCDTEFARWITPYWSGGRWVTDMSPMLALLSDGGKRRFAFWTVQKYKLDMDFRLSNRGSGLVPKRAVPLMTGGGFANGEYNKNHPPKDFVVPAWAEKTQIVSLLTGHGNGRDKRNCGEFCNHTHHISVNSQPEHVRAHPEAETLYGCMSRVADGVVPNQAGTWVYGRAGWCPGLDVPPWNVDITQEVHPGTNRLSYKALVDGKDYVSEPIPPATTPPDGGYDARIELTSWLVFYAKPDFLAPTLEPTPSSTPTPTAMPTPETTAIPTLMPSPTPSTLPTLVPTPTSPTLPTLMPTPTATGSPRPQPTTMPTTAPQPTATPPSVCICALIRQRVPAAAIAAAVAQPERIAGWKKPANPGKPVSPFNPLRECLSVANVAVPYNPLNNGLVWHAGCP